MKRLATLLFTMLALASAAIMSGCDRSEITTVPPSLTVPMTNGRVLERAIEIVQDEKLDNYDQLVELNNELDKRLEARASDQESNSHAASGATPDEEKSAPEGSQALATADVPAKPMAAGDDLLQAESLEELFAMTDPKWAPVASEQELAALQREYLDLQDEAQYLRRVYKQLNEEQHALSERLATIEAKLVSMEEGLDSEEPSADEQIATISMDDAPATIEREVNGHTYSLKRAGEQYLLFVTIREDEIKYGSGALRFLHYFKVDQFNRAVYPELATLDTEHTFLALIKAHESNTAILQKVRETDDWRTMQHGDLTVPVAHLQTEDVEHLDTLLAGYTLAQKTIGSA